jgi:hypothetical protein
MQDIQFQEKDSQETLLKKLRQLNEEVARLSKQRIVVDAGEGISVRLVGNRYIVSLA